MSRTSRVVAGTVTAWVQFFLNLCLQVTIVPLLLKIAGAETLGAYAVLMQVLGYLALVDLGLSSTTMRFLAQAYGHNDNGERFRNVLSTARTCLLVTNMAFAGFALLLSIWLRDFVNLSETLIADSRIGISLIAVWAIVRSPWVVYAGGLIAIQKMASANATYMLANIVRLLLSIGFVLAGMGLVGLILANTVAEVVSTILFVRLFRKYYRNLKLVWKIPDRALFREILRFGLHISIINLASLLIFSTGNMVVGFLYGAIAASVYYSTQFPATSGYNLMLMIGRNAAPAINELFARGDLNSLRDVFLRLYRYTLLLAIPFVMGLLLLNRTFIDLWAGPQQYGGDLMTLCLAGLALIMCISGITNVFVQAKGDIRLLSILTLCEGVLNVLSAVWLGRKIGIAGVVLATLVTHIPTTAYLQWRAQSDLQIGLLSFLRGSVLPSAKLCAVAGILLISVNAVIRPATWIGLVGTVLTFLIAYGALSYRFALVGTERARLVDCLRRMMPFVPGPQSLAEEQG